MSAEIGTVLKANLIGKEFPCVKVSETTWVIKDGLKWLCDNNLADVKAGPDIFIVEYGE